MLSRINVRASNHLCSGCPKAPRQFSKSDAPISKIWNVGAKAQLTPQIRAVPQAPIPGWQDTGNS